MIERERERLINSLLGFEHQAEIAIRDARKVRKALEAGKDEKAERECSGLDFAVSSLNSWINSLPKGRTINKTCSQCKHFALGYCNKASSHVLETSTACEFFSKRKGDKK